MVNGFRLNPVDFKKIHSENAFWILINNSFQGIMPLEEFGTSCRDLDMTMIFENLPHCYSLSS